MARIHTIEWTPAIIPHPTVRAAMRGNWYGLLGRRGPRVLRRVIRSDALTGIPGSRCDDHGVPYAITEEFVAVYRMHPLLPGEFVLFDGSGGQTRRTMLGMTGPAARAVTDTHPLEDLLVSVGRGRPGLLALHNHPEGLRWAEEATVAGVIERHVPQLGPTVGALPSAFAPWGPEPAARATASTP
jgi:hypothetical protein